MSLTGLLDDLYYFLYYNTTLYHLSRGVDDDIDTHFGY